MDLWRKVQEDFYFIKYSPFILNFVQTTLNGSTFSQFIADENCVFDAILDILDFALSCAYSSNHLEQCFYELQKTLKFLRSKFQAELTVMWHADQQFNPTTAASHYADFINSTNYYINDNAHRSTGCALSTVTLHMRLHAVLAQELKERCEFDETKLDIINTYAALYSEALADAQETLLRDIYQKLEGSPEDCQLIEDRYCRAFKYEIEFCVSQQAVFDVIPLYHEREQREQISIFASLTSICKSIDPSDTLSDIDLLLSCIVGKDSSIRLMWEDHRSENATAYSHCIARILQYEKREDFDLQALQQQLHDFCDYEKSSCSKVLESKLLEGARPDHIKEVTEVEYYHGCERLVRNSLQMKQLSFYVVTHDWCWGLVTSTVSAWGLNANEAPPTSFCADGYFTIEHKLRNMQNNLNGGLSVYIGTSLSDLLCLLDANIGIVVGLDNGLREVGTHFGVRFIPLFHWLTGEKRKQCWESWGRNTGRLFTVESWAEIHCLILGYRGIIDAMEQAL